MTKHIRFIRTFLICAMTAMAISLQPAAAESKHELDRDAEAALNALYAHTPAAKALGDQAKGVLVFPNIVKAGFLIGVQGGDGVMFKNGEAVGYYNSSAVSYGLQAGVQSFGYGLFFMNDSAMKYLKKSHGWEFGVGPSVVVVDAGMAKNISTTTAKSDIYAFIFDQKGLMVGLGLQGSKITKISK